MEVKENLSWCKFPRPCRKNSNAAKEGYKTISDICIERLKRAGEKVKQDHPSASALDTGFRVFRLTRSHFSLPENEEGDLKDQIKKEQEFLPLESLVDGITEVALKNGYGLHYNEQSLREFADNDVRQVSDEEKMALICLDSDIKESTIAILCEKYTDCVFFCRRSALNTSQRWTLWNKRGDEGVRII